ncbi:PREDICTED: jerky protein homolog-like, partial [Wasmannia auropunctata]|uniref:jerky protein homolog-like n=1 Tax=Wasmannia auropunctata TaxID=64793 RepID=UPI0005F08A2E
MRKNSADKDASDKFCQDFLQYITENQISLDTVYNADETGLNWKILPNITMVSNEERRAPGRKARKDRVTLMVCTNASGTHKLPLLFVGKYKKPRCFKNVHSLPVIYMSQNKAWMDQNLMLRWYQEVFLPEIEKVHGPNSKQCILLLDNAPSHPSAEHLNAISERCQVKYLPPNVTLLIQPMDQGIIAK